MEKLNFIDLFSGCGGLSKGLELSGMNCILGVDHDKNSISTFLANHLNAKAFLGDIHDLGSETLQDLVGEQKVDVIVGGPPCQGFSTAGRGKNDDPRNSLFMQFVRIVDHYQPKMVLIENVTGLLAKKNVKTLESIFRCFENIGYTLEARVLSSEEFGVPEKRRRTIIMGVKGKTSPIFPEVTHGTRGQETIKTVRNVLDSFNSDERFNNHDIDGAQIKSKIDRARLSNIPEGRGIRYQKDELELLPTELHFDVNWSEISEGRFRQTKLQRLALDKPSPTILTSRTTYYHPTENRYLTAREAASIQSFPNDFVFYGSTTSQFKQIGNAVPVQLGKAIGNAILNTINAMDSGDLEIKSYEDRSKYFKRAFHYPSQVEI
jgi:DNA (cytosine-5)-methyltransferase 1